MTQRFRSSILLAALALAAAGAAHAATLIGVVRNQSGVGLANVDLDFIDTCTGDNLLLFSDKTASDGSFNVVVPLGTYDIHFTPPTGSTVAAAERRDYVVTASASLGVTTLLAAHLVSGTVLTPAFGPASGVELKFVNVQTGFRVHVSKDATDLNGAYAMRVLPGTYDVDYRPSSSTTYADAERFSLVVGASDITGLTDTLRAGYTVTGVIQDTHGALVKNVDIDVFDECTGRGLSTAHDNTGADGVFSICVPAGTYTFDMDPPRCKAIEAGRAPHTVVADTVDLGTRQLRDAVLVSGIVHGPGGLPLNNAKIRFYDDAYPDMPRQAAADDHSDSTGAFSIYVPTGTYDIDVDPPVGTLLLVSSLKGVVVGGPTNVGTVTLATSVAVSGHVLGAGSTPVLYVDLNAVDSATRDALHLANDDTDTAGNVTVVVPPGTYDFQYAPPPCTGWAPASQKAVTVSGTMTLPTMSLVPGIHINGFVRDLQELPVPGVDLDFYTAGTTDKSYTPDDVTVDDGTYDVVIAPGSYDVKYIPPVGTRLRPAQRLNLSLLTTQTLSPLTLANGWLVSGLGKDAITQQPVEDVSAKFYPPGGSTPLWTVHDETLADGSYSIAVDPGTWDILYLPPAGSPYAPLWRRGVSVTGDVALSDALLQQGSTGVDESAPRLTVLTRTRTLTFSIASTAGDATLSAWDVAGRRVATLWRGRAATPLVVEWRADDVAAGVYCLRLDDASGSRIVQRVVVVR